MPYAIDEEKMAAKTVGNQSYSLTNPPLKFIPHQEFPKMLYLWPKDKSLPPTSKTITVNDAKEEKAMLAKGYRDKPHVQEFAEELPEGFEADFGGKAS